MICPRCMKSTPAFSTRCPWCTSEHGILQLWFVNLLGFILAVGVIILFFMLVL
jgi:hypothetical protein